MTYKGPKKKAWHWFSLYTRLRDCIETTGTSTYGICITCGARLTLKELQCGHAIPGRGNSILLDDTLCAAQCVRCNIFQNGQHGIFALKIIDKYGREYYEEAIRRSKQGKKMVAYEWQEKADYFKEKYEGLLSLGL
jgi:hypothetical protein